MGLQGIHFLEFQVQHDLQYPAQTVAYLDWNKHASQLNDVSFCFRVILENSFATSWTLRCLKSALCQELKCDKECATKKWNIQAFLFLLGAIQVFTGKASNITLFWFLYLYFICQSCGRREIKMPQFNRHSFLPFMYHTSTMLFITIKIPSALSVETQVAFCHIPFGPKLSGSVMSSSPTMVSRGLCSTTCTEKIIYSIHFTTGD